MTQKRDVQTKSLMTSILILLNFLFIASSATCSFNIDFLLNGLCPFKIDLKNCSLPNICTASDVPFNDI